MASNTDRMLAMIDAAVAGATPFLPVRLMVFPEFAQGASLRHYPPYSWPGGSQIVDFDGRILGTAS